MRTPILILLAGCTGSITDPPVAPPPIERANDLSAVIRSLCGPSLAAGHLPLHRLSNTEYGNTVRDLLFTRTNPALTFRADPLGTNGFSNDALALSTDESTTTEHYHAAMLLAHELVRTKDQPGGAWSRIVRCDLADETCARDTLNTLAARAWRRPVADDELAWLTRVFAEGGLEDAVVATLLDPSFLFVGIVNDRSQDPDAQFALDAWQLASRLSYFVWQSMPDDALFAAAADGSLLRPEVLAREVKRMLADEKSAAIAHLLRDEYAGLKSLGTASIDGLDDSLRLAMVEETDRFIAGIVREDRPFTELLTSTTTYATGALADFQGASPRMGLLTRPAVLLAISGSASQTHPIRRGQWVAQRVLCADPPPRPPNLTFMDPASTEGLTQKQILEQHSTNPACSGCHKLMDPLGLSLEHYDATGKFRAQYDDGKAIDAAGALPSGLRFDDALDLFRQAAQLPQVKTCFTQAFTGFALSRRAASADDACLASVLGQLTSRPDSKFSDLVLGIVTSSAFTQQRGEAP